MLDYTFSENSNSSLNENSWCDQPTIEGMEYELNSPPDLSYLENDFSTNLNHPDDDPIELDQYPALNDTFEFREPESIPERSRNENFVPKSSNSDKNVEEDDDALIEYFQKLREGRLPREDIDRFEPVDVTPNWIRANKSIGINMVHSIIFRKGTPDFDEMMKKVEAKKSSPDIEKPDSSPNINNFDNDFDDDDFENIIQKEPPIDFQRPGPSRASLKNVSQSSKKVSEIVIIDSDDEEPPKNSTSEKVYSDVEMKTADSENDGFDSDDSLEKLFTDPTVYPTPKNSGPKISKLPTPKSPTQINPKSDQPTHISEKTSPIPTCNKNDFTLDFSDDDFNVPETSHQNNQNLEEEQNDDLENFDDIESDGAASPIIGSSHPRIFPQPSFRESPKNSDDEFDEDFPSDSVLNTGIVDPNLSELQIEAGSTDITMEDPLEISSTEKTSETSSKNSGFLDQSAKCEESNDFDDDFSGDEFFNQFLT